MRKGTEQPVIRISKGHFEPGKYAEIAGLIADSAAPLVPALDALEGLLYYHASVDENTNTVVNVSVWESEEAAKQMDNFGGNACATPDSGSGWCDIRSDCELQAPLEDRKGLGRSRA